MVIHRTALPYASRVGDDDRHTREVDGHLDEVTSGPWCRRHDGCGPPGEGIEEGGLASVGGAEEAHSDTAADDLAPPVVFEGPLHRLNKCIHSLTHTLHCPLFLDIVLDVVVTEVNGGLQPCQRRGELVPPPLVNRTEAAPHLTDGLLPLRRGVSSYQISQTLNLHQVQSAILESPPCVLAPLRRTETIKPHPNLTPSLHQSVLQPPEGLKHSFDDRPASVQMKLHSVVASEGVGGREPHHQALVEQLAHQRIIDAAKDGLSGGREGSQTVIGDCIAAAAAAGTSRGVGRQQLQDER
mmetsp:Transcript_3267/g.8251  ORF Transcript_3267/g.8251 Transcript_3267/m.8251 type:complete len:297 (-) Transcript_3267:389-1279(-)